MLENSKQFPRINKKLYENGMISIFNTMELSFNIFSITKKLMNMILYMCHTKINQGVLPYNLLFYPDTKQLVAHEKNLQVGRTALVNYICICKLFYRD